MIVSIMISFPMYQRKEQNTVADLVESMIRVRDVHVEM